MKKTLLSIISIVFVVNIFAQNVTVDLSVDKNPVSINDRITLTFNINNASEGSVDFTPPENFRILSGPNQSQSMSFVNGKRENNTSISYILKPLKTGTFKISPAKLITTKKEYTTNSITVQVNNQQSKSTKQKDNRVFVKTSISKKEVFVGENILVEYKLYTRVNGVNLESIEFPDITGVWSEVLENGKNGYETRTEKLNGVLYNVFTLKKEVIFPQITGEIKIDPVHINLVIGRSFFEAGRELELNSAQRVIKVKPLPSPKPKNFINIVGDLKIKGKVNHTTLKNNESLNYDITISGSGNLKLINEIPINVPLDFEIYEPNITKKIKTNSSGMTGYKTFQYVIVPRYPGKYTIPKIQVSYFNTVSKKYENLTLNSKEILVTENENYKAVNIVRNDSSVVSADVSSKEDVNLINKDIKHINLNLGEKLSKDENTFISINKIIFSYLLFLSLLITAYFLQKNASTIFSRKKNHYKTIISKLEKLKDDKLNTKNISSTLNQLLEAYFINCLNITKENLSNQEVIKSLQIQEIPKETVNEIIKCKSDIEMMQYASQSDNETKDLINQTIKNIKEINKHL